jgi:hypothetical protein
LHVMTTHRNIYWQDVAAFTGALLDDEEREKEREKNKGKDKAVVIVKEEKAKTPDKKRKERERAEEKDGGEGSGGAKVVAEMGSPPPAAAAALAGKVPFADTLLLLEAKVALLRHVSEQVERERERMTVEGKELTIRRAQLAFKKAPPFKELAAEGDALAL